MDRENPERVNQERKLARGVELLNTNAVEQAIAVFTEIIASDPTNGPAYKFRGKAFARRNETKKAIADLTEAIKVNRSDAVAFYIRGTLRLRSNQRKGAIEDFEAALKINPVYEKPRNSLIALAHRTEDRSGSGAHLRTRNRRLIIGTSAALATICMLTFVWKLTSTSIDHEYHPGTLLPDGKSWTSSEFSQLVHGTGAPYAVIGHGSGFFVNNEGILITNNHVVADCSSIGIISAERLVTQASIVATDQTNDIAAIKVPISGTNSLALSARQSPTGSEVFVFGWGVPETDDGAAMLSIEGQFTRGIINSSVGLGDDKTRFQLSAQIHPGSSGAAVLDKGGRILGVAVQSFSRAGISDIGFGIKASMLAKFLDSNQISYAKNTSYSDLPYEQISSIGRQASRIILCIADQTELSDALLQKAASAEDMTDAEKYVNEAIARNPRNARAYAWRGIIRAIRNQGVQAFADIAYAMELKPNDWMIYWARGSAELTDGQFDKAIKDFSKAITLDGTKASPYEGRSWAWKEKGNVEQARMDQEMADKLRRRDRNAR